MKSYFVYILANKNRSIFYTGVTNDLIRRVSEHKTKAVEGFTSRYNISHLLYFEIFKDPESAITREKQIKKFLQKKKINLIQTTNVGINDLFDSLAEQ